MKRIARLISIALVVLVVLAAGLWWGMRPPPVASVPARGGTIADVTLIEPGVGRQAHRTLVIDGGTIAGIREDGSGADGAVHRGGYALPGLIDMHVHQPVSPGGFDEYFGLLYLLHGVTTVRDTGYSYPDVLGRRSRIAAGAFPGPRVFTCGPLLDGDPPLWEDATVVAAAEDARAIVATLNDEGVDCIKVYTNLSLDVLDAINDAADRAGLPVIGHAPAQIPFARARLDDVQHLTGVPDQSGFEGDANPMAAGWRDISEARIAHVAQTSVALDIAHTPTLVFLDYNSRRDRPEELKTASGAAYLPSVFADVFWRPPESFRLGGAATPALYAELRAGFENGKRAVHALHERGVRIHAGTDTGNPFVVPGVSLQRELRLLVEAGLSTEEALATATLTPGAFLSNGSLGRIRVGAPADLLIFAEDPTQSLDALDSLQLVVADGRIYETSDLEREVARYREHYQGFTWANVVPLFARLLD